MGVLVNEKNIVDEVALANALMDRAKIDLPPMIDAAIDRLFLRLTEMKLQIVPRSE